MTKVVAHTGQSKKRRVRRDTLPGSVIAGSRRKAKAGARRLGKADPSMPISLTVTLRGPTLPEDPAGAQQGLKNLQASQKDADLVCSTLRSYGFKIESVSLLTRSIKISGTVANAEAAFSPRLGMYKDQQQGIFRDRAGAYKVPTAVSGIITAVLGLGQRRVAHRKGRGAPLPAQPRKPLRPQDIERRYQFPEGPGRRQHIGIAEFGGGYFADDLRAYCSKFGKPMPKVNAVSINRPAYDLQQILKLPHDQIADELDDSIEVMMDVEIIAGLCPHSEISVYFAQFDQKGWVDLLDRAILDRPTAISISWGSVEDSSDWSAAALQAINERLHMAAVLGITVCVASGDDGSGDGSTGRRAHVDFPSSSPFVLSVGGTKLAGTGSRTREVTWWDTPGKRTNHGGGSTGGGVSRVFARPAWQTIAIPSINKQRKAGRIVPDVAALAADPRYDLVFLGADYPRGAGTSASAPVWAALVARLNALLPRAKQQRALAPLLYQKTKQGKTVGSIACRDITSGNNRSKPPGRGYGARRGFDAVTGWGTPMGRKLLRALTFLPPAKT